MKNINIALISPHKNVYSETFIQQHRLHISGNIIYYFNGNIPTENDLSGTLLTKMDQLRFRFKQKLKITGYSVKEQALIQSFKKQKIHIVVAEYGTTAADVVSVCEYLKLPLIPIFHGYDASIKSTLINYKKKYRFLFKYAKKIIVVSEKIKDTLINLGCDSTKIIGSPCAPEDVFFDLKPMFKSENFFGVGRFVDKKAPYYTILAFQKVLTEFPEAKLVLAGDGDLFNTCKNLIDFLGIHKSVALLGRISPEEVKERLLESIAFVQHSILALNGDSEGTPVAILEASAASLPVISTFHGGISDVILNKKTGFLVNEHDVFGMAEKMIFILRDIKKAKEMGIAGRDFVYKSYRKSIHIEKINQAIKEVYNG